MTEKTGEEKEKVYQDNLKKTFVPVIFGVIGGILSSLVASESANNFGIMILILMIMTQIPVYEQLGINKKELKPKDWFFISSMTFFSWFVTWGLILNMGA